jgi:dTDP-4-amino-4,6-dideoxygalactose transaminase
MKKVKLFSPNAYSKEWSTELEKTFKSGWLAQSGKVKEFEEKFCEEFGYKYAVALNSGTAALDMAYHLVGIGPGDKVLTPVLTCTATNIPLVHRKAHIVFCDIDDGLTIDYEDVKKKISPDWYDYDYKTYKKRETKALVTVNLGGIGTDDRVFDIAEENDVPVIVDAAQALGITQERGDYICYSFQAIKHFTTGDGGMIVLSNEEDYERAKRLRWFGIDRDRRAKMNFDFSPSNRAVCMDMDEPGFKTHMNDIQATMGIVGLSHNKEILDHRYEIGEVYIDKLKIPVIAGGSWWLFCVMLEGRDEGKMDKIKASGVECDLVHLRNDIFTPFGSKRLNLPNMNKIESQYLYIPIHSNMTVEDAEYVAEVINENR